MNGERYANLDPYTLEELRRKYNRANTAGRLNILKPYKVQIVGCRSTLGRAVPYELALLAVQDRDITVREWIARHISLYCLDFNESQDISGPPRNPELDLFEKLKHDIDPFVRAALRENPTFPVSIDAFLSCNPMERLALLRNPSIGEDHHKFIEALFDPDDQSLGVSSVERLELLRAYLSNASAREDSHRTLRNEREHFLDGGTWAEHNRHWSNLWKLALKWTSLGTDYKVTEREIGREFFKHFGAEVEVKAEVYRQSQDAAAKYAILEESKWPDDREVISLGMQDSNETCRFCAYAVVGYLAPESLEAIIAREGAVNLQAFGQNDKLQSWQLEKIKARLEELLPGDMLITFPFRETIARTKARELQQANKAHDFEKETSTSLKNLGHHVQTMRLRANIILTLLVAYFVYLIFK